MLVAPSIDNDKRKINANKPGDGCPRLGSHKRMRILFLILVFKVGIGFSQNDCSTYEDEYIPKNLNDAISYLDCSWPENDKAEFSTKDEGAAVADLHFGTGLSIRNGWDLWKGKNSLSRYFKSLGIYHPDDMSSIILTSFHRHLNNKDVDLKGQVEYYKEYWEQANNEYEKENEILTERIKKEYKSYRSGDTVKVAFELYKNQNPIRVYPIQGYPDLNEEPNCYVTGIVRGKRIRKGKDYTLILEIIDICGYEEVYWGDIYEKYSNFKVGGQYDFFGLKSFKIRKD